MIEFLGTIATRKIEVEVALTIIDALQGASNERRENIDRWLDEVGKCQRHIVDHNVKIAEYEEWIAEAQAEKDLIDAELGRRLLPVNE